MNEFTEDELRDMGLLPQSSAEPTFSLDEISDLGVPVAQEQAAPETTEEPLRAPETTDNRPFRQFRTDMYNDLSFRDQMRVFQEFMQEPTTTRPVLGLGYAFQTDPESGRRTYIQPPSMGLLGGGRGVGTMDLLATGLAGGVSNALELGGAVFDRGAQALGYETDAASTLGNFIPRVNTGDNIGQAIVAEGAPIMAGGIGAGGAALNALRNAPRIIRGLGAYLAAEGGATLVSPTDAGGFIVGENALLSGAQDILPILRGVNLDDPTEAEEIIEARVNLLVDGLITGGIVARTATGAAAATKLAYNLTLGPLVNLTRAERAIENRAVEQIFDQLGAYRPNMSPAEQADFRRGLTDIIEQNREVLLPRLDDLDSELVINMDTLGALLRGIDTPEGQSLYGMVQSIRQGQITSNRPMTTAVTREPQAALDQQTDEFLRATGGDTPAAQTETMLRSADEFAEQGRDAVRAAQTTAEDAARNYDDAVRNFTDRIGDDIELTEEIRALSRARGTEVTVPRDASRDEIMGQLRQSYETMVNEKNARYGALTGGEIDTGSLFDALSNVRLDELSRQATTLRRTSPLSEIADLFQPRRVPDDGASAATDMIPFNPATAGSAPNQSGTRFETRDEVIERVNNWFARDPDMYNFGYFHTVIRPELSELASSLYARNEPMAGRAVRDVIRAIDDDMVDFVGRRNPELADAAVEARRYYREEFAPFWRDGRLEEYSNLYDSTVGRTGAYSTEFQPTRFGSRSINLVEDTISSGNMFDIQQFRNLLSRPEAGANSDALASYMVYDAIGGMAAAIRASDITDVPIDALTENLRQYSNALNTVFPERASELNAFIRRVEGAQGDLAELRRIMDEASEQVTAVKEAVQASELSNFFRSFPDAEMADPRLRDLATSSNAYQAFERIFRDGRNSIDLVDALMRRVDAAPEGQREVLRAGMETAYARYMRNTFLNRGQIAGDIQATSAPRIDAAIDGSNPIFEIGDRIFADRPEVMRAVRDLTEFAADSTRARNAPSVAGQSNTAFNQNVAAATNRIIYATMGPLTRAGTRVRALINAGVETVDPTNLSARVMDEILSDPARFVAIARRIEQNPTDPQLQELMAISIMRGIARSTIGEDTDPVGSALQGAADVEMQMRDLFPR